MQEEFDILNIERIFILICNAFSYRIRCHQWKCNRYLFYRFPATRRFLNWKRKHWSNSSYSNCHRTGQIWCRLSVCLCVWFEESTYWNVSNVTIFPFLSVCVFFSRLPFDFFCHFHPLWFAFIFVCFAFV